MKAKANPFRCAQCGSEGILQVIKGKPYCLKDAEIKQGIRDKNGLKKEGQSNEMLWWDG